MPKLFEPFTLRGLTVRNRIWLSPMCQYSVHAGDGVPTDWHLVHLGARAQGGFGLLLAEATAVTPEGRISPLDTGLWNDAQRDAWARIVRFAHSQQAAIGIQLAHAGRKGSTRPHVPGESEGSIPPEEGGWETIAPSAVGLDGLREPLAMTAGDVGRTVEAFAAAARRADQAGFDVVEIHAAHGYLIHEFLSPLTNRREDAYGGDFEGRTRFLTEIVTAVRAVWPDRKPLFVRVSATDWIEGGWDVSQSARLARVLAGQGVDLIDVSSGGIAKARIPVRPGYQVPFAAQIRRDGGLPTAAVGLILQARDAEEVLQRGDADAVLIARPALREAGWPLRAAAELGLTWQEAPYPPPYTRGTWDEVIALD